MTSVVINPYFDWGYDRPPNLEYHESVIYEAHVKGLTQLHPAIPEELRGTYAGMAHPAIVEHLTALGITAVELMPVHQFVNDPHLQAKGLSNYWGYNTIGFFAPHNGYAAYGTRGEQVQEFKTMVKAMHEAGIEVILDVVYNHTAEGNHLGPTLSFRGIDNASYYRLVDGDEAHYFDTTGTGNSLLMRSPHTLQMIMDSLRYWVEEMHVDGFRFDLASTLARELHEVDRLSAFFDIVQQDPVISQVKLIAEPWDVGEGGYQVGGFPPLWSGVERQVPRHRARLLARRAVDARRSSPAGSPARRTCTSTAGAGPSRRSTSSPPTTASPCATSSPTTRSTTRPTARTTPTASRTTARGTAARRAPPTTRTSTGSAPAQQRNYLATLLISQGVPMIAHGDELGRTQQGNNNVYCQDNELSWVHWDLDDERAGAPGVHPPRRRSCASDHPVLRRRRFFAGSPEHGGESELGDIEWFRPSGEHMSDEDWGASFARSVMVFLNGSAIHEPDARGERVVDDSILALLNADADAIRFTVPGDGLRGPLARSCSTRARAGPPAHAARRGVPDGPGPQRRHPQSARRRSSERPIATPEEQ